MINGIVSAKKPYLTAPCRVPRCENTGNNYFYGYCSKHARFYGVITTRVDSAPVVEKLHQLRSEGCTVKQIATGTNLPAATIYHLLKGKNPTCRKRIHDAIMAYTPNPTRTQHSTQPTWQLTRRVQALRAAGFSVQEIAEGSGVSYSRICEISKGTTQRTRHDVATGIRRFFDEHKLDTPRKPSRDAAGKGWLLPMQWENIDAVDGVPSRW